MGTSQRVAAINNEQLWRDVYARDAFFGGALWRDVIQESENLDIRNAPRQSIAGPPQTRVVSQHYA